VTSQKGDKCQKKLDFFEFIYLVKSLLSCARWLESKLELNSTDKTLNFVLMELITFKKQSVFIDNKCIKLFKIQK